MAIVLRDRLHDLESASDGEATNLALHRCAQSALDEIEPGRRNKDVI